MFVRLCRRVSVGRRRNTTFVRGASQQLYVFAQRVLSTANCAHKFKQVNILQAKKIYEEHYEEKVAACKFATVTVTFESITEGKELYKVEIANQAGLSKLEIQCEEIGQDLQVSLQQAEFSYAHSVPFKLYRESMFERKCDEVQKLIDEAMMTMVHTLKPTEKHEKQDQGDEQSEQHEQHEEKNVMKSIRSSAPVMINLDALSAKRQKYFADESFLDFRFRDEVHKKFNQNAFSSWHLFQTFSSSEHDAVNSVKGSLENESREFVEKEKLSNALEDLEQKLENFKIVFGILDVHASHLDARDREPVTSARYLDAHVCDPVTYEDTQDIDDGLF